MGDFSHGGHDVLHDEVVEAAVDVEEEGGESEVELEEVHGGVGGGDEVGRDDFGYQDVVDEQAERG